MYHYCTGCGRRFPLIEKDGEAFDINNLMSPDIQTLGLYIPEGNEKSFTLPISGLTATIKEGKIYLEGAK
jgi:hypothetical protein